MNMKIKTTLATAVCIASMVASSFAHAAPPSSVSGRWSILGNRHSGFLDISQSLSTDVCKPVSGVIYPGTTVAGAIRGYYCPSTGRVAFARKNAAGVVIQTWVGNVSDVGVPLRMGGTFHALDAAAGSGIVGEYHFQGQK